MEKGRIKGMKGVIVLGLLGLLVVYVWAFESPIRGSLPWRTEGHYFTIEWEVPENVAYYRCFLSADSVRLVNNPFSCFQVRTSPPLKPGKIQQQVIRYIPERFAYDLYVEVFAFDIDGNYWNLDLLNFKEDNL
jgi:hypothetical protein